MDHCVQVSCAARSGDQIFDLSSLTLLNRSHSVLVSPSVTDVTTHSAAFYINVCRPVARQSGVHCPPDASVCRRDSAETFVVSCLDAF